MAAYEIKNFNLDRISEKNYFITIQKVPLWYFFFKNFQTVHSSLIKTATGMSLHYWIPLSTFSFQSKK
jgi:hypothetical protein